MEPATHHKLTKCRKDEQNDMSLNLAAYSSLITGYLK